MTGRAWLDPAGEPVSLGRSAPRPGSLAGLAEARRTNLGQFFTPRAVAAFAWSILQPAMARAAAAEPERRISLFDPAVGSGRLLQFADPARHSLWGVDCHAQAIDGLKDAAAEAGFVRELIASPIEEIRTGRFDIGLLNPPFSLTLESPTLDALPCTTFGRYGPNTRALSHRYMLELALQACSVVVAIVPAAYVEEIQSTDRLRKRLAGTWYLPREAFAEEGTAVEVAVLAFAAERPGGVTERRLDSLDAPAPDLGLDLPRGPCLGPRLRRVTAIDDGPAITRDVTGDRRVRVTRNGRRLVLRFACGATEARVLNAVYRELAAPFRPQGQRLPKQVRYRGQGALDIEVHLEQPDPIASVKALLETIRSAGGEPAVDASVWDYLRHRMSRLARARMPLRRVVWDGAGGGAPLTAVVNHTAALDPDRWGSPVLRAGESVTLEPCAEGFTVERRGHRWVIEEHRAHGWLSMPTRQGQWREIEPGVAAAFPVEAAAVRRRAEHLGISDWLWPYQLDDVIEGVLKPGGMVGGLRQGLGKSRLALAFGLLAGDGPALICTDPDLVEEDLLRKLQEIDLPPEIDIRVIRGPQDLEGPLARINLIAYTRLRRAIDPLRPRRTYAAALRRRVTTLIADEGDLLSNPQSAQSRALWRISARRRYPLTGTPIANYPRDILPLLAFTGGDGRAGQPWGWYQPYLQAEHRRDMAQAERGIDAFRKRFVVTTWVTNEFAEDFSGARREVPAIADVPGYRAALAPWVKRRVHNEPDVAPYAGMPDPEHEYHRVEWDPRHLAYYLPICDDFRDWYQQHRAAQAGSGRAGSNLVAVLARIMAVRTAAGAPQLGVSGFGSLGGPTSKQRWIIERAATHAAAGIKTAVYVWRPGHAERLVRWLADAGIEAVAFHGNRPIGQRMRELRQRFRFGPAPVLVATLGAIQKGKDIPEAHRAILAEREWTSKAEGQAIFRMMRPQQREPVTVEIPYLPGSLDEYMDQMVTHKASAIDSGLDWGAAVQNPDEFLHLDTLLGRFCEDLSARFGVDDRRALRAALLHCEEQT